MSMKKHVISNATVGVWKNMFWDHMMKWSVRKELLTIHTNFLIYASFNKKNRTATVTTGKTAIRRVPECLPCAIYRAHGKPAICRVSPWKHTGNKEHSANCDVRRVRGPGTRQTPSFVPCACSCRQVPSSAWRTCIQWKRREWAYAEKKNYAIKCYYICYFF